ncbi:MAG: hypothetical protein DRP09_19615 [Candidatus Thorarchaeota archaeon]|nr:MAG: hypothetical protein DRP09_19615 [Candidatus Thorarchaeota archaeon]
MESQIIDLGRAASIIKTRQEISRDYFSTMIRIRHVFMKEYGWIPLKEFLEMSAFETLDLLNEIEKDYRAQKSELDKMKMSARRIR